MFDPTKYKSYRYHSAMLYIDEKATITDVKNAVPLFFENAYRGEKREMYRGHLICSKMMTFSDNIPRRHITVYAFDVRRNNTFCIDTDSASVKDAKELIRSKLEGEPDPLTLEFTEVEVFVPAKVRAAVFRDKNGKITQTEVSEFLHVGDPETSQQPQPGDTFTTFVWSCLPGLIRDQTPA